LDARAVRHSYRLRLFGSLPERRRNAVTKAVSGNVWPTGAMWPSEIIPNLNATRHIAGNHRPRTDHGTFTLSRVADLSGTARGDRQAKQPSIRSIRPLPGLTFRDWPVHARSSKPRLSALRNHRAASLRSWVTPAPLTCRSPRSNCAAALPCSAALTYRQRRELQP